MKPAPFDYVRAETVEEALQALDREGASARVIAGGQTLVPMLNMRLAQPSLLVDIMRLPALGAIERRGGKVVIGAAVRQCTLEAWPELAERLPVVHAMMPWLGHAQTRSRGTVCGSIAHADPSAELPLALVLLGGTVELASLKGRRSVEAEDFLVGMMATDLGEREMIRAVALPEARPGTGYAFREFARRHGDFAIVACAAAAGPEGTFLAVAGVDDRPRRFAVPAHDDPGLDDALNDLAWALNARTDLHASARYRRELVRRLGRITIQEAARCRE
jgi:2-furoyl-CoA dehydrogenase FAD binding subunit